MKLSTRGRYELRTLLDLALRQDEGLVFTIQPTLNHLWRYLGCKLEVTRYHRAILIPTKMKKAYLDHAATRPVHPGVTYIQTPTIKIKKCPQCGTEVWIFFNVMQTRRK